MAGPSIVSSIYFQQQAPDILGSVSKGLSMRDMMDTRALKQKQIAEDDAIKQAYKVGITQNPDGTTSFDSGKTASAIMGVNPQKGLEFQKEQVAQEAAARKAQYEKVTQTTDFLGRASNAMKQTGGQGYSQLLEQAKATGMDTSMMPPVYGPDAQQKLDYYFGQALSTKEQMERADKDKAGARDDARLDLERQRVEIERGKAAKKAAGGEDLPLDSKKMIEGLSTKNANKIGIKNQIESVMSTWDKLSDDQKVAQGGQLLKTLNSPEGADAIGAEEAKRLGSKLQFAMGNFTNGNPTQFGRDFDGFKTQALGTAASLGDAVGRNQAEVDRLMGRKTEGKKSPPPGKPTTVVQNGHTYTLNPQTGKYE